MPQDSLKAFWPIIPCVVSGALAVVSTTWASSSDQEADYAWVTLAFLIISAFCACFLTRDKTFHISVSITFTTLFALDSMYFYGVIGKLVNIPNYPWAPYMCVATPIAIILSVNAILLRPWKRDGSLTQAARQLIDRVIYATPNSQVGGPPTGPAPLVHTIANSSSSVSLASSTSGPPVNATSNFPSSTSLTSSTSIASQASPVNTAFSTPPSTPTL